MACNWDLILRLPSENRALSAACPCSLALATENRWDCNLCPLSDTRGGGGAGARPPPRGAPGKPLLRGSVAWDLVCDLALRVCDIVWLFVMVRVLSGLLSSFSCL